MSETTQGYLGIGNESRQTNLGFQSVLNYIRENARSERQKGDLFERLMLKYFTEDPTTKNSFPKSIFGNSGRNSKQNLMVQI